MINVSFYNNFICMWKFLVYGCDVKFKIWLWSRIDFFWLRRRWICCYKILWIIMFRLIIFIYGRLRFCFGIWSLLNVVDRVVCKIVGKCVFLYNFIIILRSWLCWIIYLFILCWCVEILRSRVLFRIDWFCVWLIVCLLCFCGNFFFV